MTPDTQPNRIGGAAGESGVSRRTVLELAGGSVGLTALGTGPGSASDGPRHLQVRQPDDLCDTVPGDHHLAFVEDGSHTRGRGFYAGTSRETWTFVGWLRQTRPSETATGSVTPDDGASEPSHRLVQVGQPSDLQAYEPTDQHVAYVEDTYHERGRGFYVGTKETITDCTFGLFCSEEEVWTWQFVGWLPQLEPDGSASGSVGPASGATRPSNRLVQVEDPADLQDVDPSDHHLAFVRDESHEKGRGFYSGGGDGSWYFVGWLAQSRPAVEASDTVDPNGSECGSEPECAVDTDSAIDVGTGSATLTGSLDDLGGALSAECYFEWRKRGNDTWNTTVRRTRFSTGDFDEDISNLDADSSYEYRAVGGASDGDSDTGETHTFTTASSTSDGGNFADGAWRWYADDVDGYESWLGEDIQVAANGHGKTKWRYFVPYDARDFPSWVSGGTDRLFLPHIPMLPREETDAVGRETALRNLAAGEYDDKFRTMAEGFADDGFTPETLVLRIGNEFNIQAQPYSPVGTAVTPETWIEGYRRIVAVCRDVLGSDLRTVWSPLLGSTQMGPQEVVDHYPGSTDAMVGGDIYDKAPAYEKESQAPDGIEYDTASEADRETVQDHVWTETHLKGNKWGNDGAGLNDIARLSDDVGRPIAIPEWGLEFDDYVWGGDVNPVFVRKMYDWMDAHDVRLHAYFEVDTSNSAHALATEGEFDFAAAEDEYRRTFGGG